MREYLLNSLIIACMLGSASIIMIAIAVGG